MRGVLPVGQYPVAQMSEATSGIFASGFPGVAALTRATGVHPFGRTAVPSAMMLTPFRSTIIPYARG
jgi:hypothetical protein